MKISRLGEAPDYRFSLANERTFLAWIRTALGFLAMIHHLIGAGAFRVGVGHHVVREQVIFQIGIRHGHLWLSALAE